MWSRWASAYRAGRTLFSTLYFTRLICWGWGSASWWFPSSFAVMRVGIDTFWIILRVRSGRIRGHWACEWVPIVILFASWCNRGVSNYRCEVWRPRSIFMIAILFEFNRNGGLTPFAPVPDTGVETKISRYWVFQFMPPAWDKQSKDCHPWNSTCGRAAWRSWTSWYRRGHQDPPHSRAVKIWGLFI